MAFMFAWAKIKTHRVSLDLNKRHSTCYTTDMPAFKDLSGRRFGRLIVTRQGLGRQTPSQHKVTWICHCDCGNRIDVIAGSLTSGNTRSCGCLAHEVVSQNVKRAVE